MNKKPIIGIIGKSQGTTEYDLWHRNDVVDEIRYLVVKNGGIAISLLPTEKTLEFNDNDIKDEKELSAEELVDLYKQLELCDGFILQGGLYSCNYEIEMAKKILELNKPLIGICAGFNNILRALGTDVILDETRSHDYYDNNYRHSIDIKRDTLLYNLIGKDKLEVNSIHSMVAPKEVVEPFATISSFSEDGLVESFELHNKNFVMGIKWHPELLLEEEYVDKLFEEFIHIAKASY
ncbi:MAG: gamma-glutamyl-gamma-aminobutyrate hydrolase family protein [Clostridia bacterium]|nr:gamma-glutamyl-gamma-aminobutyrate hydrolase family protein [Clostridia bacterium]